MSRVSWISTVTQNWDFLRQGNSSETDKSLVSGGGYPTGCRSSPVGLPDTVVVVDVGGTLALSVNIVCE